MLCVRLEIAVFSLCALVLSSLCTGIVYKLAISRGMLDVPNERSSHRVVTPRGGGVAVVLVFTAAAAVLAVLGIVRTDLLIALGVGGVAIAVTGYFDDARRLPAGVRLTVQLAAAIWALVWLGSPQQLVLGDHVVYLGWAGPVLAVVSIIWTVNFFNFMDGIDGIAASEAVFVVCSGAFLSAVSGNATNIAALAAVFGAACLGFLTWNWPPARIFMGDAGSGYLGYVVAVLAVASSRRNPAGPWIWLILTGVFFVDATVTLIQRALRHERIHEAHRSHGYQYLARRWRSHRKVTLVVIIVNLVWLLPCALLAGRYPHWAAWITAIALAPLVAVALAVGSGQPERPIHEP
jgi:Fuc2NAc and GlcNAc transferase